MTHLEFRRLINCVALLCISVAVQDSVAETWSLPIGGNVFRSQPSPGSRAVRRDGTLVLNDYESVYAIYFHLDRPASIELAIKAKAAKEASRLVAKVESKSFEIPIDQSEFANHPIGEVEIENPGYARIDLKLTSGSVEVQTLEITSDASELDITFVRSNKGNMFYWGRRGPSVHLRYNVPRDKDLVYAYSELTIPKGQDPVGSYFMANGFAQGYFGIQVNGPKERRVLFSVWSPFKTDNPKDVPLNQRIACVGHGKDVHVGKFGNEGSGGQSYLVYPWVAGRAYRFLTEVQPDKNDTTVFTSWFGDKANNEWKLIASFRRPKTDTHLQGFHSFLENFSPASGHIDRQVMYENIWVRDVEEKWYSCTKARFSVDATGGGGHRLDFNGGTKDSQFYLRNCGFFNTTGKPGTTLEVQQPASRKPPAIDLAKLPR